MTPTTKTTLALGILAASATMFAAPAQAHPKYHNTPCVHTKHTHHKPAPIKRITRHTPDWKIVRTLRVTPYGNQVINIKRYPRSAYAERIVRQGYKHSYRHSYRHHADDGVHGRIVWNW